LEVLTVSFCLGYWLLLGQVQSASLAQIKMAAENGDAKARISLAMLISIHVTLRNALVWYRKAAEQGWANLSMNWAHADERWLPIQCSSVKSTEKMDER